MLIRFIVAGLAGLLLSSTAIAEPWLRGSDDRPIEPIAVLPSIQQGVDMIYVDPDMLPAIRHQDNLLKHLGGQYQPGVPDALLYSVSPIYSELRRALKNYGSTWARLPQVKLNPGATLRRGAKGERVAMLRERLGLPAGSEYDEALAKAVTDYQQVHGIKADGITGEATAASLDLGADYFVRVLMLNLDRARTLPGSDSMGRYILVDAGAARLYMFEDGVVRDSMKVIVGKAASATPMMASMLRYASVNPYWNVPVDLAQTIVAPKVLAQGLGHIDEERYQILSDWSSRAEEVDPSTIDWEAVADGSAEIRVRQRPGLGNSMGAIKFMMPNDYGIYLHDTNNKALFEKEDRWISNGCVRVEDARRLAEWLFGSMPAGTDPDKENDVQMARPVPVYITYLTAVPTADGGLFRNDPYDRDAALIARYQRAAGVFDQTS